MRILILDPSGNTGKEGNGITGWSLFVNGALTDFGNVKAADYTVPEVYWSSVIELITIHQADKVVYEDYKLFAHKALQQSGSDLETPQLIGALRVYCYQNRIPIIRQSPKNKVRFTDPILVHTGVLTQSSGGRFSALGRQTIIHERDAIRHGVFYHKYAKE